MLNQSLFSGSSSAIEELDDNSVHGIETIFSTEITQQLRALKDNRIDNLIIHKLPIVKADLGSTPTEIHGTSPDIFAKHLIELLGKFLGQVSEKGVENSIRFKANDNESTNVETWHGHPQFKYSVFYCLRGDENARTYFLSANDIVKQAKSTDKEMLLSSGLIKQTQSGHEFSEKIYRPSDFQQNVENLDLPDATKALSANREDGAFSYLLRLMADTQEKVIYQSGDVVIYNERQTMRFSPSYNPSTNTGQERWLLGVGVY